LLFRVLIPALFLQNFKKVYKSEKYNRGELLKNLQIYQEFAPEM